MKSFLFTVFTCLNALLSMAQNFGADQIIDNNSSIDALNVRVQAASNGHLFAVVNSTSTMAGGFASLQFYRSTNNGVSWTSFRTIPFANSATTRIPFDMTIVENGANVLAVVTSVVDQFTGVTSVHYYTSNLTTLADVTNNFSPIFLNDPILDVAIANDSDFPSSGSSPASVAVAIARNSAVADSIISYVSQDGGMNFPNRNHVVATSLYVKKLSLDYGRSAVDPVGKFICAWQMNTTTVGGYGRICVSTTSNAGVSGPWQSYERLDDLSPATENRSANPKVAAQRSASNNASGSYTAMVVFESDPDGVSGDQDIYAVSNTSVHNGTTWTTSNVSIGSDYTLNADVVYDKFNQRFAASHYNFTADNIRMHTISQNSTGITNWTAFTSSDINDLPTSNPYPPRIIYVAAINRIGISWIKSFSGYQTSIFDIQESFAALPDLAIESVNIHPNPTSDELTIRLKESFTGRYSITNVNGVEILSGQFEGQNELQLDVSELISGTYFLHTTAGNDVCIGKFIKQ